MVLFYGYFREIVLNTKFGEESYMRDAIFTDHDIYLFKEGTHYKLYNKLGAHFAKINGIEGINFALWAPNAKSVSVIGNFNGWNTKCNQMNVRWDSSGIFELFIPHLKKGEIYKYHIVSKLQNQKMDKADPFAFYSEKSPLTASIVWDLEYNWSDQSWMKERKKKTSLNAPFSIYEVHLGSWKKEFGNSLTYRELGDKLVKYVKEMGFTFVEFLPLMEHPFFGSWGYQSTGYFAPTSRYGTPQDLMYLIEEFHKNDIGVILDWVPSHFPTDPYAMACFDGTHLYEHADPRKGFHPDWKSFIFNYGRKEVKEFLISSAFFWLEKFHVDGIRIDAVASMLYLDYSRKEGEWIPNEKGGRENLEAISFLQQLNAGIYAEFPDVQTFAEESTAWPLVTSPTYIGGLGFGMKWNMGWMHDVLSYFSKDPIHRKFHHNELTFSMIYAFFENFLLSLSHDEVVHGKRSLLSKMPGDEWQKFANLRLMVGYLYTHVGKKLLFMGGEFGQKSEWNHDIGLDWNWNSFNENMHKWTKDLNYLYREEKALHENDFNWNGFEWINCNDNENSVLSFLRKSSNSKIAVICNFTPVIRENYRIGVDDSGKWKILLNSDDSKYGGSNFLSKREFYTHKSLCNNKDNSLSLTLPPLGILILKHGE